MTFFEILQKQGIAKEQYSAIMMEMLHNRIFLTKEEKIEERYHKLKLQRNELNHKLNTAYSMINGLQDKCAEQEKRISSVDTRERNSCDIRRVFDSKIADLMITTAIQQKLSDAKYPDLLVDQFDRSKLTINADGSVDGIEEQLAVLKDSYQELFITKENSIEGYHLGNESSDLARTEMKNRKVSDQNNQDHETDIPPNRRGDNAK